MSIPYNTPITFSSYSYKALPSDDSVGTSTPLSNPRTSPSFLNSQLRFHGVASASSIGELSEAVHSFVRAMSSTGAYDAFRADIAQAKSETGEPIMGKACLIIEAKEKNWYKVKVGGGVKHDADSGIMGGMSSISSAGSGISMPTVQFEVRNTRTCFEYIEV